PRSRPAGNRRARCLRRRAARRRSLAREARERRPHAAPRLRERSGVREVRAGSGREPPQLARGPSAGAHRGITTMERNDDMNVIRWLAASLAISSGLGGGALAADTGCTPISSLPFVVESPRTDCVTPYLSTDQSTGASIE